MKKVDRLFVGPELFEKRPVVGRGVGDGNQFGPHLADVSDLFGELRLQRRLAGFRPKTERFQTIAFRVPETDRPAGRPACFFVPVGAERNPVERDRTGNGFAGFRLAGPWPPALFPSRDCPSFPTSASGGSTTGSCLPALRRVWPLPAACNGSGPGERRPGSQPSSTGENESLRVRKTGQRGSSASAQPEPCRPPGRPFRPGVLAPPGTTQRPAYPTSKSANAPLPFGPFLDEGCERPERLGGRGPLLDDGRKSSHRLGGHRGEFREGQTMTATLAWGCGFEPTFCRVARSILFCPVPKSVPGTALCHEIADFGLESPQPESE